MNLDERIFNEIGFLIPTDDHNLTGMYTDRTIIETLLKLQYPKTAVELQHTNYKDYQDFIQTLLNTAQIGVIPTDSIMLQALHKTQTAVANHDFIGFKLSPLFDLSQLELNFNRYFISDINHLNPIDMDLFNGTGDSRQLYRFLQFINHTH